MAKKICTDTQRSAENRRQHIARFFKLNKGEKFTTAQLAKIFNIETGKLRQDLDCLRKRNLIEQGGGRGLYLWGYSCEPVDFPALTQIAPYSP